MSTDETGLGATIRAWRDRLTPAERRAARWPRPPRRRAAPRGAGRARRDVGRLRHPAGAGPRDHAVRRRSSAPWPARCGCRGPSAITCTGSPACSLPPTAWSTTTSRRACSGCSPGWARHRSRCSRPTGGWSGGTAAGRRCSATRRRSRRSTVTSCGPGSRSPADPPVYLSARVVKPHDTETADRAFVADLRRASARYPRRPAPGRADPAHARRQRAVRGPVARGSGRRPRRGAQDRSGTRTSATSRSTATSCTTATRT